MRPRDVYLENSKTLGDSGVETIDLDVTDPISELYLKFEAINGATSNVDNLISHNITKIEVIDGSDVLFGMIGRMARSLYAHTEHKISGEYYTGMQADTPIEVIPIRFGTRLYDPIRAFNPSNFLNPQLKITWNLATIRAVDATGFSSGSLKYSLIARIMEQAPAPTSFLMSKEVDYWTSAASGDHRTDLPVDYPYRLLMVRAYERAVDFRDSIKNLKLSVDSDKYVPFNLEAGDFCNLMLNCLGELNQVYWNILLDATARETWMGHSLGCVIMPQNALYIVGSSYDWKSTVLPVITKHDGTRGEGIPACLFSRGTALENCYVYPFGALDRPEEWFTPPSAGSLRLFSTMNEADADCRVVVQQDRSY